MKPPTRQPKHDRFGKCSSTGAFGFSLFNALERQRSISARFRSCFLGFVRSEVVFRIGMRFALKKWIYESLRLFFANARYRPD